MAPALDRPNVTLLTNAFVSRLETNGAGREATAVHVERNGAKETYSASVVVVSAGAINSTALLLRSTNDKHPRGLANSSDNVGRHYMGHVNSVLLVISKCPNPTIFQKTLAVNDYLDGSFFVSSASREPGADHHGQRPAGGRPPGRAAQVTVMRRSE